MKHLFILLIRMYWRIVPSRLRRECIFKTSCSHAVYDELVANGLLKGFQRLTYRMRVCNCNATVFTNPISGELNLLLSNGEIVERGEMAASFFVDDSGDRVLRDCYGGQKSIVVN